MASFDERLQQRLLAFQQANGLTAGGVVDTATWQALVNAPAQDPVTVSPDGQWRWDGAQWLPVNAALGSAEGNALGSAGNALGSPGGVQGGAGGTPHTLTPPLGGAGLQLAGLPAGEALVEFAPNSAALTADHKEALQRVAADLAGKPLGHGGRVTLAGSAGTRETSNHELGQQRADAALAYLRGLIKDEETKAQLAAHSLGAPRKGDPDLGRVEVTITRREHHFKPVPKLELPGKKVPTIDLSKLSKPIDINLPPAKRPPEMPTEKLQLTGTFLSLVVSKPVPRDLIAELSAFVNKVLHTDDLAKLTAAIAGRLSLSESERAALLRVMQEKFQSDGEERVKKVLTTLIEGLVGEEAKPLIDPHGPSVSNAETWTILTIPF